MPTLHLYAADLLEPGLVAPKLLRLRMQILITYEYVKRHRLVRLGAGRRLQAEASGERNSL